MQNSNCKSFDWKGWSLVATNVAIVFILAGSTDAAVPRHSVPTKPTVDRCLVRLNNRSVATVAIAVDGTVLDFPLKPSKVILGRKGSFGIEYVESDLAVSPLTSSSKSHLYVYLQDRRFTFDLFTTMSGGCAVISVRDSLDNQVTVDGLPRLAK
jgi:hypothetical protein